MKNLRTMLSAIRTAVEVVAAEVCSNQLATTDSQAGGDLATTGKAMACPSRAPVLHNPAWLCLA